MKGISLYFEMLKKGRSLIWDALFDGIGSAIESIVLLVVASFPSVGIAVLASFILIEIDKNYVIPYLYLLNENMIASKVLVTFGLIIGYICSLCVIREESEEKEKRDREKILELEREIHKFEAWEDYESAKAAKKEIAGLQQHKHHRLYSSIFLEVSFIMYLIWTLL